MPFSRYARTSRINLGKSVGTQRSLYPLYIAAKNGTIPTTRYVTKSRERLDIVAGRYYGSGIYWWVIACTSGIGWGMQVPPGTVLIIPLNISDVEGIVG